MSRLTTERLVRFLKILLAVLAGVGGYSAYTNVEEKASQINEIHRSL